MTKGPARVFGPEEAPLFGLHEPPSGGVPRDSAVVLCYPAGQGYIRAHRAFVQLARRLAGEGFSVLRFDYTGTGDSAGESEEGTVARWLEDVRAAVEEAKRTSGCHQVHLVGLRLGATLAALVARDRDDVDRVALWAPVRDGPAYLRELEDLQAAFLRHAYVTVARGERRGAGRSEVLGFPLTGEFRAGLEGLRLDLPSPPDPDRLLVIPDDNPGLPRVWLAEPYEAIVPVPILDTIVSWLASPRR